MIVYCYINQTELAHSVRETLLQFCYTWTEHVETETLNAWYCQIPDHLPVVEFGSAYLAHLKTHQLSGVWGAGISKFIAKAVVQLRPNSCVTLDQSPTFAANLPIDRLPLSEPEICQLYKLGINTLGQLAKLSTQALTLQFGKKAAELLKLVQGEDPQPFQPDARITIGWEKDFLTDGQIGIPIGRPQLDLFLQQGLAEIEQQLLAAKLTIKTIRLDWYDNGGRHSAVRKFNPPTSCKDVFFRSLLTVLPANPIYQLKIAGHEFSPLLPKQLDIFGQNPTNQKIDALKTQLSSVLVNLQLSRREKILLMWEQAYL